MKKLKILTLCCIVVLGVIGCQNNDRDNTAIDVKVEGGGQFPQSLVGKWKSDKNNWELTFAEDGTITKAKVAFFGRWEIVPGQKTIVPMRMNKQSIITPGKWLVQYSPANQELVISIILESFHVEIGDGYIDGKTKDILAGRVDLDANKWYPDWTFFLDATANTPEKSNFPLSNDPVYGETKSLVFSKVVE